MSPKKGNFNNFNRKSNFNTVLNSLSGSCNNIRGENFIDSVENKSNEYPVFLPCSPIKIPTLMEKKRRQSRSFQKDLFPHLLKRKPLNNYIEKNNFSFPFSSIKKPLNKSNGGLISELHYEVISAKNVKRKKTLNEEESSNVNLSVLYLNINDSKGSIGNDENVSTTNFLHNSLNTTFPSCNAFKDQGTSLSNTSSYSKGTSTQIFSSNFMKDGNDEGSIVEILSPVKIKKRPCLFNLDSINSLNKDSENIGYEEDAKLYPSDKSKIFNTNNLNLDFSHFERVNQCGIESPELTCKNNINFCKNIKSSTKFSWESDKRINANVTARVNRDSQLYDTCNSDIVPETQFSTYFNQKSLSPTKEIQCFFEPPSQIFKGSQHQLEVNLKTMNALNHRKRGRPCKRLKVKTNNKWSWLHNSFTDYLNKNYCETQRRMHDMIINTNLLKFEVSMIGTFPIWGVIFFKSYRRNREGNIAVICSTLNVPNVKMNREYIFKIYPKYNFVTYSPYDKVIINPIMNVL
uniref:Uncharacterized protein n=1 Tax=Strongyloides stercoralis TaxID=6248 RepID=A0A0K0DVC9_STRER